MQPEEQQQPSNALEPAVAAELRRLVQQAKAGDVTVLPRLRQFLDQHPAIWETVGDLERVVVRAWAELLGGDDPLSTEAVRRKAESLRAELEGDNPTPLERLLAGQVVSGWLEMSHAQLKAADPASASASASVPPWVVSQASANPVINDAPTPAAAWYLADARNSSDVSP